MRDVIRRLHYSIPTEQDLRRLDPALLFHGKRQPAEIGAVEVEAFLTELAVQGQVASSTQSQALNAIVFLYRQILKRGIRLAGVWEKFGVIVKIAQEFLR
ncbi:MAG: site-specific integrase [Gammaproteobacteria bacterium]